MAKPKLRDLKRYLNEMTDAELREEILKLFGKFKPVQEFYAQELMTPEERKTMLDQYKKKIYNLFYTRSGSRRKNKNPKLRQVLSEFEQVSIYPMELTDLVLYRVEVAIDQADRYGGMPEADYKATAAAFEKCLNLIEMHRLEDYFRDRCREIAQGPKDNFDYLFKKVLNVMYQSSFG